MIYQKDLEELDLETIEEYFDIIVENIERQNNPQARFLIKDLSKNQRKDALDYIELNYCFENDCEAASTAKEMIENTL